MPPAGAPAGRAPCNNTAPALPAGFPPAVVVKGADVPFVGGAPLATYAPQPAVDGFYALPGVTPYRGGRISCAGSLK